MENHQLMKMPSWPVKWVLIPLFCSFTGYTRKAVERKIEDGKWIEGIHYMRAPDGHILMNVQAYNTWVESKPQTA